MSRFARISFVAVPVLALSLMAVFRQDSGAASSPAGPVQTASAAAPTAEFSPLVRDLTPGVERVYSLNMTQATASRRAERDGEPADTSDTSALLFQVEVQGHLSLTLTDKAADSVILRAAFADVSFRIQQGSQPILAEEAVREVERSLREAAFVEMSPRGQIKALHFAQSAAPLARTVMRAVITSTQPQLPAGGERTWDTVEGDAGGELRAFYRRTGPATLTRSKGEYLRVTSPKGLVPTSEIGTMQLGGKSTFTLDESGWVQTMTGIETLAAEAKAMNQLASTRVEVTLTRTTVSERPDLAGAFARAQGTLLRTPAAENDMTRAAMREVDEKRAAGARPRDVLASLAKLSAKESVARADRLEQLAALVRLDGRAAADLAGAVRGGLPGEDAGTVIGALASAGTAEAQRALSAIVEDRGVASDLRADATMALATAEDLSTQSVNTLRHASQSDDREVRSAGALGLGAAAKTMAKDGDEAGAELVTSLLDRLASAASPEERATLFHALGNSGDARMVPHVKAALVADGPTVRAAAVAALRLVEDEAADALIAATLLADPERMVRNAALFATSFRAPAGHLASLDAYVKREPLKSLRMSAVSLLGKWRSVTGAATVLAFVMDNDADAEVRAAAEALLNG